MDSQPRTKTFFDMLQEVISSKKAMATIAAAVLVIAVKLGLPIEESQADQIATWIVYAVMAYLGGQGLADFGKESAKTGPGSQTGGEPAQDGPEA